FSDTRDAGPKPYGADRARITAILASTDAPPPIRARALYAAAQVARLEGDLDATTLLAGDALALWRSLGDHANEALALIRIANAAWPAARFDDARRAAEEALGVAATVDDPRIANSARTMLCQILVAQGDAERAEKLAGEILETTSDHELAPRRSAM